MRIFATTLALVSLLLLFTSVSADTGARVVRVEGTLCVVPPGDVGMQEISAGEEVPPGSRLVAEEGSRARIELPGLGVLTMTGPATVRLTSIDGVPAIVLGAGRATFEFQSGKVILQVARGRLVLSGVAGYSGPLAARSSVFVSGNPESVRVQVHRGPLLLTSATEHVLLGSGDAALLGLGGIEPGAARGVTLRSSETEIQLPPEVAKSAGESVDPYIQEMQDAWKQKRESPRIP